MPKLAFHCFLWFAPCCPLGKTDSVVIELQIPLEGDTEKIKRKFTYELLPFTVKKEGSRIKNAIFPTNVK